MGVLPADDAGRVRSHAADCGSCGAELAEMTRVTSLLPFGVEETAPPPGLRDELLNRIGREPVPIASVRQRRLSRYAPLTAAAALALLALGGLAGFVSGRVSNGRGSDPRDRQLVEAAAQGQLSTARVQDGDLLVSVVRAPGARQAFAWLEGLPELPEGKAYQAWFLRPGALPEPGNVFRHDAGTWLEADRPLEGYTTIAFTIEDDGGAKQPSGRPLAMVELSGNARAR